MTQVQAVLAGRYELLDVLGRGGMGVVYRANDRVLERAVAVKVLAVDRADDPVFVRRFEREALAAAALSHPNIVAIYDSGRDEDMRFIVMECVRGISIAELVRRRGRLPAPEAVELATPIAGAMAAAHRAGIIHRDIKPANVMVDEAGTVKVLDFGIARAVASTSLTRTAMVLGSAPYMAPEVARGETADARSDIYSLGCVLYEMLTGKPPFTGELPAAVMHQHNTARPRPPRAIAAGVPPALDALVLKMLAKRPAERPRDALELTRALPASLHGQTAVPLTAGTAPTSVLPDAGAGRRHGPEPVALAVAVVLVLVGLAFALLDSSSPHRAKPRAPAGARATSTAHGAASRTPAAHTPATQTTAAPAAAPTTIPAVAGALTTLVTQDLQSGKVDQQAAQPMLGHLQDVLNAYDSGNIADALHHTSDLSTQIAQLGAHGDISPTALPAINSAVSNLQTLLERAASTSSPAEPPPPGPGHGKGNGHVNEAGDGQGQGD